MKRYRHHIVRKVCHVLLQSVTNDQIQTPDYAQGIPCNVASCHKRPDTDSTLRSMYTLVLLQAVTNGQTQIPH